MIFVISHLIHVLFFFSILGCITWMHHYIHVQNIKCTETFSHHCMCFELEQSQNFRSKKSIYVFIFTFNVHNQKAQEKIRKKKHCWNSKDIKHEEYITIRMVSKMYFYFCLSIWKIRKFVLSCNGDNLMGKKKKENIRKKTSCFSGG